MTLINVFSLENITTIYGRTPSTSHHSLVEKHMTLYNYQQSHTNYYDIIFTLPTHPIVIMLTACTYTPGNDKQRVQCEVYNQVYTV